MAKKREALDPKYQWDLSSLYPSDEAWEKDFEKLSKTLPEFESFKGHVLDDVKTLKTVIEKISDGSRTMSSLMTYAKMKSDENTKNTHYQSFTARVESLIGQYREATSFLVPELIQGDEKKIQEFMKDDSLSMYQQHIDNILRARPHTLSQEAENLLAQASEMMSTPSNAFGMLSGADLKFPSVKKGDEEIDLSHGSFVPLLMEKDRDLREETYHKYYGVYEDHKNVFASLLASEVKKNIFNAKARKHPSARASALFENNIPESVYDNLINAVHANLDALHEYISLRKEMLGVDVLKPFDLYVPLIDDVDMTFEYEKAKETVLTSLSVLGDDYTSVVEKSFTDGWIDVYENEGKRSGAYSWGTYDSKPYIMLNYHDKLSDMFTLTHEMGHSMHSYYTRKNQPFVYGHYSIFVAEVASTTNEALLNKYLLDKVTDKKEKLYLLNNYLENFRGTVFRQTMFAEFEREIHSMVESGKALTSESLSDIYRALNEKYYGKDLQVDDQLSLEWARIPHFYYNFYVFQYATGFSSAEALANKIVEEGKPAIEAYFDFLGAGCSDYPIEVLKKAGVDMTTPEPVDQALATFRNLVKEMKSLLAE